MSKRIMSVFLIVAMLLSTVCVISAEETETTFAKISDELLDEIGVSYENIITNNFEENGDLYSCIIWIEDVDLELAVEAGVAAVEQKYDTDINNIDCVYAIDETSGAMLADVNYSESIDVEYLQTYIEAERDASVDLYEDNNGRFVSEFLKARDTSVKYVSKYSPCIFADLNVSKIADLLMEDSVNYIGYVGNDGNIESLSDEVIYVPSMTSSDIQACIEVMRVDEAKSAYGLTGAGVKVGLMDFACPSSTEVIKHPGCTVPVREGSKEYVHANLIYSILHTIAPNATYYAAGYYETNSSLGASLFYEQIEWMLSSGVNIITSSMDIPAQDDSGNVLYNVYSDFSRWLDHIAYNHDVHFVQAAGNNGDIGVISMAMAYNIITVGNTDWTGTYVIDDASSYNDDGNSRTEQRTFKPDIVAPANCTSYATPMVTGTIALLCELNPALKTKQPIVKSILAAGAGAQTRSYVTTDTEFRRYGAGIVDALASSYIVAASQYSTSTGILSATVGESKTYNMEVSSSDSRMRIAMTYSNRISLGTSSSSHASATIPDGTIAEVGLYIYDPNGNLVTSYPVGSTTNGVNLRIIEFDTNGNTGTYTIEVYMLLAPSNNRATNFGVAWW